MQNTIKNIAIIAISIIGLTSCSKNNDVEDAIITQELVSNASLEVMVGETLVELPIGATIVLPTSRDGVAKRLAGTFFTLVGYEGYAIQVYARGNRSVVSYVAFNINTTDVSLAIKPKKIGKGASGYELENVLDALDMLTIQ